MRGQTAQHELRLGYALLGGQPLLGREPQPAHGLALVLRHVSALGVQEPEPIFDSILIRLARA